MAGQRLKGVRAPLLLPPAPLWFPAGTGAACMVVAHTLKRMSTEEIRKNRELLLPVRKWIMAADERNGSSWLAGRPPALTSDKVRCFRIRLSASTPVVGNSNSTSRGRFGQLLLPFHGGHPVRCPLNRHPPLTTANIQKTNYNNYILFLNKRTASNRKSQKVKLWLLLGHVFDIRPNFVSWFLIGYCYTRFQREEWIANGFSFLSNTTRVASYLFSYKQARINFTPKPLWWRQFTPFTSLTIGRSLTR